MSEQTKLPQQFFDDGLQAADGAVIFGVPLASLSHDELMAVAAMGWKAYTDSLQQHIGDLNFLTHGSRLPPNVGGNPRERSAAK